MHIRIPMCVYAHKHTQIFMYTNIHICLFLYMSIYIHMIIYTNRYHPCARPPQTRPLACPAHYIESVTQSSHQQCQACWTRATPPFHPFPLPPPPNPLSDSSQLTTYWCCAVAAGDSSLQRQRYRHWTREISRKPALQLFPRENWVTCQLSRIAVADGDSCLQRQQYSHLYGKFLKSQLYSYCTQYIE